MPWRGPLLFAAVTCVLRADMETRATTKKQAMTLAYDKDGKVISVPATGGLSCTWHSSARPQWVRDHMNREGETTGPPNEIPARVYNWHHVDAATAREWEYVWQHGHENHY